MTQKTRPIPNPEPEDAGIGPTLGEQETPTGKLRLSIVFMSVHSRPFAAKALGCPIARIFGI